MLGKILQRVRESSGGINSIAQDLDIGKGTLDAVLEVAVERGYMKKIHISSSCGGCALSKQCNVKPSECDKTKVYFLTRKGEERVV